MMNSPEITTGSLTPVVAPYPHSGGGWPTALDTLLADLGVVAPAPPPVAGPQVDNQLVQVRLGVAASLFVALRLKHPPAAAHALRVALTSSAWCVMAGLSQQERDAVEVASLLHDVGVIGLPDAILAKPASLNAKEALAVERCRESSLEILRCCCVEASVLEIVENVPAWFDGSKPGYRCQGDAIPLGARMVSIVEAYDAMTTDRIYRPARSPEWAIGELYACAGRQFDPALVDRFVSLQRMDLTELRLEVCQRWLQTLDPKLVEAFWGVNETPRPSAEPELATLFQVRLLRNMHDAVVFIDSDLRIIDWNHGAERLTGISANSICQHRWQSELLNMRDERDQLLTETDCPVAWAIRSGVQSLRRLTIWGRNRQPIAVDAHVIPVMAESGRTLGAVLLLHDASSETSLEQRCQSLHEKATKDPLTQVANRAEFDRVHEMFVAAHQQRQLSCSLVICDLDRFKQTNDTFGHQAGDEVICSLAAVLKTACRAGDLVARYGGEEFVVLFADCDGHSAACRAEEIRKSLAQLPQPKMEGRTATASFGVTEIQPGDSPETMLRRADRALLEAKAKGRNRVVLLGTGLRGKEAAGGTAGKRFASATAVDQDLYTRVPLPMAIEKLRGFVADHQAEVLSIEGNRVRLEISALASQRQRRRDDRPVRFVLDLSFEEQRIEPSDGESAEERAITRTRIHVSIAPKEGRNRRQEEIGARAREVLVSFRSYLMATEERSPSPGVLRRVTRALAPWLVRR
jgi:diguanylate cyclase (GGDEF)-like protein